MAEIDSLHFSHFEVLRKADGSLWEMGRGGMGVTYKAFDRKLRVDVVLKLPHEQLMGSERNLRLFLREARAAAKVRHPNIASVIHLNDEPPYFYVMELVAGQALDVLLKTRKTLPLAEALDILDQIAAALGGLAGAQIVHRDLKPANLVLLPDEDRPYGRTVKLIDFGLAKGFSVAGEDAATYLQNSLSEAGVFSGTAIYASPEQCAGALDLDTRSDLYSAGIVLWQMLTGGAPFTGSLQQIIAKQQLQPPPWATLADVPEPIVELLRQLLAKEPDDRLQTPRALREAIRAAAGALTSDQQTTAALVPGVAVLSPLTETLKMGTTLVARYRLGVDLDHGDDGRLFRAADNATGDAPVAVKVLPAAFLSDRTFTDALARQLTAMRQTPNPIWLGTVGGLERSGEGAFFVREWADGFSLEELLRARHGELAAAEVWLLLEALPRAIDIGATEGLTFAKLLPRKLFVTPVPGVELNEDWLSLRGSPLKEWPPFALRWNTLSFHRAGAATASISTLPQTGTPTEEEAPSVTEDAVVALAMLVRELLGGAPRALTPLSNLRGETNAVLQRALGAGGGKHVFGSAQAFWHELRTASEVRPAPPRASGTPLVAIGSPEVATAPAALPVTVGPGPKGHRRNPWLMPVLGVLALCVVALVARMGFQSKGNSPGPATVEPTPVIAAPLTATAAVPTPATSNSDDLQAAMRSKERTESAASARSRRELIARIERSPDLPAETKSMLVRALRKARGIGCVMTTSFGSGDRSLRATSADAFVEGMNGSGMMNLRVDPELSFFVLGFADESAAPNVNALVSAERAEYIGGLMREAAKVTQTVFPVGMGAEGPLDGKGGERRAVEVWAVFP